MSGLNDFTMIDKPTFETYRYMLKVDLDAQRLDELVKWLPLMSDISVSTLMHTKDLDGFCRTILGMWQDYVPIEIWFNDCEEGMNLLSKLEVEMDSFRVRETNAA